MYDTMNKKFCFHNFYVCSIYKVERHRFPQIILLTAFIYKKKQQQKANIIYLKKVVDIAFFSWVFKNNLLKKFPWSCMEYMRKIYHWYAQVLNVFTYNLKLKYFPNLDLWDEILINLNYRTLYIFRRKRDNMIWIWSPWWNNWSTDLIAHLQDTI